MNEKEHQKNQKRNLIFWGLGFLLFLSSAVLFLNWYLPLDPKSPPATESGASEEFDNLLEAANEKWVFLFQSGTQLVATDIYGENDRVLFDLTKVINPDGSNFSDEFSISPDGNRLAINYFRARDISEASKPLAGEIFILDINSGGSMEIQPKVDGYNIDWVAPVYWLSPEIILIKMQKYNVGDASTEDVFLRYDLQFPDVQQIIDFDQCEVTEVTKRDSGVLLLTSDCLPHGETPVWAIDIHGKRQATLEEEFYYKCAGFWMYGNTCDPKILTKPVAVLRLERVTGNMEGWGRWWENNWYRNYVYLDDQLVRVSNGWDEFDPVWDSGLKLFMWDEGTWVFLMDSKGHYRPWHVGNYIGKILRTYSE